MSEPYAEGLDAESQVDAEERIAALLFDRFQAVECECCGEITGVAPEEEAARLSRVILYEVLRVVRPELFSVQRS